MKVLMRWENHAKTKNILVYRIIQSLKKCANCLQSVSEYQQRQPYFARKKVHLNHKLDFRVESLYPYKIQSALVFLFDKN